MRRFQLMTFVAPLWAALACRDATAPSPTDSQIRDPRPVLSALATFPTTPQISTGYWHVCALNTNGMVTCWGYNPVGQATVPAGLVELSQVSTSGHHTCALKADGTVVCWGDNEVGQTIVPGGLASVTQISSGYMHSCALKSDGTVVCWGAKDGIPWNYGQASVPEGLASVVQVSAGLLQTCAIKTDRTLVCWGGGGYTAPSDLGAVTQVSVGGSPICALKADQTVMCWGGNSYGETTVPDGLVSVAQVSGGFQHTCALKTDGTVVCWGYNPYGETTVPAGLSSVAQVSAGAFYTCARKTDGTVVCWGQVTAPEGLNLGVVDVTAPQAITFEALADRTLGDPPFELSASASSGLPVSFSAGGSCSVAGSTVSITGVGTCTITANQAGNATFNPAPTMEQSFAVRYNTTVGHTFLAPITLPPEAPRVFKAGSTIPVKFQLFLADGVTPVSSAAATILVDKVSTSAPDGVPVDVVSTVANAGTAFRYDAASQLYIFNLSTRNWTAGTYQITALLDDGNVITAIVGAR